MEKLDRWFDPRRLAVAGAGMFVVLVLTHIPQEMMPKPLQVRFLDKAEHVVAYGATAFLFLLAFRRSPGVRVMLVIVLAGALAGALDELTQPWVNRTASWLDFAADVIGVALVCVVVFLLTRLCRRERALSSVTQT